MFCLIYNITTKGANLKFALFVLRYLEKVKFG